MASAVEARTNIQEIQGQVLSQEQVREFGRQVEAKGIEILYESGMVAYLEDIKSAANEGRLFNDTSFLDMDYPEQRRLTKIAQLNNTLTPGPESKFVRTPGGNVAIELGWKYREEKSPFRGGQRRMVHDSLRVMVQPVTGDFVISGELNELVTRALWEKNDTSKSEILSQAIERALKAPGKQVEPILEKSD
jgi:hypothetical protein